MPVGYHDYSPDQNDAQARATRYAEENDLLRTRLNRTGSRFNPDLAKKGPGGQLTSISRLLDTLYGDQQGYFAQAQSAARKGAAASKQGFADARAAVASRGEAARTRIEQTGMKRNAAVDQSLISRGLYSSTVGPEFENRQVDQDMATQNALLDQALAEMDADLLVAGGRAEQESQLGLSQLFQQQNAQNTQLGLSWADVVSGVTHQPDDTTENLIGLFGGIAGLF